jgi:hypothetical protein
MNIEHPTPMVTPAAAQRLHSTFSVRCSLFDVFSGSWAASTLPEVRFGTMNRPIGAPIS